MTQASASPDPEPDGGRHTPRQPAWLGPNPVHDRGAIEFRHSVADHRVGMRLSLDGLVLQLWITAGPAQNPSQPQQATPEEKAALQIARHKRLQPGRTWHVLVYPRHTPNLGEAVANAITNQLIPALAEKPRRVPTHRGETP